MVGSRASAWIRKVRVEESGRVGEVGSYQWEKGLRHVRASAALNGFPGSRGLPRYTSPPMNFCMQSQGLRAIIAHTPCPPRSIEMAALIKLQSPSSIVVRLNFALPLESRPKMPLPMNDTKATLSDRTITSHLASVRCQTTTDPVLLLHGGRAAECFGPS